MKDVVSIRIFNQLPRELQESVDDLTNTYFSPSYQTEEQRVDSDDKYFDTGDRFKYILAFEKTNVIGLVIVLKRTITFNNSKIKLGGIGGVCVKEEYRKKYIATNMIGIALNELKKANCDVAYLCTDVEKQGTGKLYTRIGFVPLGNRHTYLGRSGKRYFDNDGMLAPINSISIFNNILASKEPFDIGAGNW